MTRSSIKFRTLESLRNEVQTRIGAAASTAFGAELIDSFVQDAQRQLYALCDWKHLRSAAEIPIVADHYWYDLPDGCNLERIEGVWIKLSNLWQPLCEGIEIGDRNWLTGDPRRYDVRWNDSAPAQTWNVQIEIFPEPKYDTVVRVEYMRECGRFEEPEDTASIPDSAIFLHALTSAKLHFRQPDGPAYQTQLNVLVSRLKSEHRREKVIRPQGPPMDLTYAYPPR